MKLIFKIFFEILTDPLGLPVNILTEYIILGVIGIIAFIISFRVVGNMYHGGQISTRTGGSAAHWLIRLLFVVGAWAVTYGVIWVGKLIEAHWVTALISLAGILLTGCVTVLAVRNRHKGGVSNA